MSADERRAAPAAWLSLAFGVGAIALLLQACFGLFVPPPAAPVAEPVRVSSVEMLAPFFTALAALEGNETRRPVRVLQIGDSHTANDSFSGRMRARLQARFGAAGRGWMPAGIPFRYYRPQLVSVDETGWQHLKPNDNAGVALGLDAIVAQSQPPDAAMTVESTETAGFDRFAVEFLTRPNGPAFTIQVDSAAPIRVPTAAAIAATDRFDLPLDRPARGVELRTQGRSPVLLLGWTIERQAPGVIYENHGTIGATVDLLGRMTPEAVAFELAERRPALLIVAFGTNEGFDDDLDLKRYAARFAGGVEALQRAARGVPVLVVGPPDGNRMGYGCTPTGCRTDGDAQSTDCAWHEPVKLASVRDLQRRIAARHGLDLLGLVRGDGRRLQHRPHGRCAAAARGAGSHASQQARLRGNGGLALWRLDARLRKMEGAAAHGLTAARKGDGFRHPHRQRREGQNRRRATPTARSRR